MSSRDFQVEMFWNCPLGHKRQRGRDLKCAQCGRPKTEDDEYYMPDDGAYAPEVTDAVMLEDAHAGPNWSCKFCGCHERRNDSECANCGVPQADGDSAIWEKDQKERFEAVNSPLPEPPELPVTLPVRQLVTWERAKTFLGVLSLVVFVCGLVWLFTPHSEQARVQSVSWRRSISVERNQVIRENGWHPSPDGFNVSMDGQRWHHNDHRVVGHHTERYSVSVACGQNCVPVPRVCTPVPRTCVKSNCRSNKNGYATCSETCSGGGQTCTGGGQNCTTRYCNEWRTKTVDDYQDFPVYEPYYSWDAWRWLHARDVPQSGADSSPFWPDVALGENERVSAKTQSYNVVFDGKNGKRREWTPPDEPDFVRFAVGSSWTLEVDHVGIVHSVKAR